MCVCACVCVCHCLISGCSQASSMEAMLPQTSLEILSSSLMIHNLSDTGVHTHATAHENTVRRNRG